MREWLRKFLARNRRNWLIGKVGRNLLYYYQGFDNQDYSLETNGEEFVLRAIARVYPGATVLDVGANRGDWAMAAARTIPHGRIHAIEVIPATFEKLRAACKDLPQVRIYNVGLGESAGHLEFAVAKGRDELASGLAGVHGGLHKFEFYTVDCPMLTGDLFCEQHSLPKVDFLKLDVEGLEPKVLSGFRRMLTEGRVGAVQFEYGQINLKARFFLGDFYQLFGAFGMKVGKIYPNYVDFREYHFTQDNLIGPNFIAVRADDTELLRQLAG